MLLKPATPLTILLLIAFVLLLLSVISTPIVKGIPLATFETVDYGVFGYCKGGQCTNIHLGYTNGASGGSPIRLNLPVLNYGQMTSRTLAMTSTSLLAHEDRFRLS